MAISEKKIIPLSMEKCEAFIPKKEKEREYNLKNLRPQIDLNLVEEDDKLLKVRDIPRRKSSTGSTLASKPEDPSELPSFPNSPISSPQNSQQSGIFFGRDRNCSNPIFNFYQNTEENLRETHLEHAKYKKTKNYMLKDEFFKNNMSENKIIDNTTTSTSTNNIDNISQSNNIYKTPLQTTSVAAVMGTFTPKICSCNGGKGKFDLPMYYVGFYGWDSKYTNYNHFYIILNI